MHDIDIYRRIRGLILPAVIAVEPSDLGCRGFRIFQIVRSYPIAELLVVRLKIRRVIDCHEAHPRIAADRRVLVPSVVFHDLTERIAILDIRQIVKPCTVVVQIYLAPEIDSALAAARSVNVVAEAFCIRFRRACRLCIRVFDRHGVAHLTLEPLRTGICERICALAIRVVEGDRHDRRADTVRRDRDLQRICAVPVAAFPFADVDAVFLDVGDFRIAGHSRHAAVGHCIVGSVARGESRHGLQLNVALAQILGCACCRRETGLDRTLDRRRARRRIPIAGFCLCSQW